MDPEIIAASKQGLDEYGTLQPWCRLVTVVDNMNQVEEKLAELLGTEAVNIFASTTLLSHGTIPALLGRDGILLLDKSAHATMYEGGKIARDNGSKLVSFRSGDLETLENLLKEHRHIRKKLIAVDGVYSMTGDFADLPKLQELAKAYEALLYIDDAHGFGVIGENPSPDHPFGQRGNGLVRYYGLTYDNILYVGSLAKAFGSMASFIACSKAMREFLLSQSTPHDLGHSARADAMMAALAAIRISAERGDALRDALYQKTRRVIDTLRELGFSVGSTTGFPIINVWLGNSEIMIEASKVLYDNHIILTLAPYPMVTRGNESFRITVTVNNTDEEIEQLIMAFTRLKEFLLSQGVGLERGLSKTGASR
jgi:8-amino-7-oxononanoate synthase